MNIYIDESGNLGTDGRFFVIAALLPSNDKRIKNLVKNCSLNIEKDTGSMPCELKGYTLTLPHRQDFILKLTSRDDFYCAYIVADKHHLNARVLSDKNICFNYLASHLIKRILRGSSEDMRIIFDNRTVKVASLNSLGDYLRIKAYTEWGYQHNLTVEFQDSKNFKNLQAVDIISNTIFRKYDSNQNHPYFMLEPKFQHIIRFPYQRFGL